MNGLRMNQSYPCFRFQPDHSHPRVSFSQLVLLLRNLSIDLTDGSKIAPYERWKPDCW